MFHGLLPENARRSEEAKLIKPQHLDKNNNKRIQKKQGPTVVKFFIFWGGGGGEGYVVTFAIQGPSRSVSFEASSGIYIFSLQTDIRGIATLTMY